MSTLQNNTSEISDISPMYVRDVNCFFDGFVPVQLTHDLRKGIYQHIMTGERTGFSSLYGSDTNLANAIVQALYETRIDKTTSIDYFIGLVLSRIKAVKLQTAACDHWMRTNADFYYRTKYVYRQLTVPRVKAG